MGTSIGHWQGTSFVGPLGTSLGMGQLPPYHLTASGPEDQDGCCRPGPHGCQSKWRGIVLAMDGWPGGNALTENSFVLTLERGHHLDWANHHLLLSQIWKGKQFSIEDT